MRVLLIPLVLAAATVSAQDAKTASAKQGAKAPVTAPATKQDAKAALPQTKQDTKATPPATKSDTKAAPAGRRVEIAPAVPPKPVEILREAFDYTAAGRRDPFNSLMTSSEIRPTIADLRLVGVLYHPTRPVATMLDVTSGTSYRATLGSTLGRMRVALIKPRVVIFSIEEFGINRQDSLVLGDTTKVRAR